ncbi:phosphatase PAP2 family protein [Neisseriaceae bacterium PsAf]|nr:phosphatase PAP2 family protein [Neisseriaceae bacterium PsAf]
MVVLLIPRFLPLFFLALPNFSHSEIETLDDFNILRSEHPNILEENTQKVVEITQARTAEQEQKALYDSADVATFNSIVFVGPSLDYALGGGIQDGWLRYTDKRFLGARNIITLVAGANVGIVNTILKNRYSYPRPFVLSDDINKVSGETYNKVGAFKSFPSGHTALGYFNALLLAQLFPERYPELMTAASDFGHSRILLGVHYPLDVMGSRMVVMSQVASLMSHPIFRSLISIARLEVRTPIEFRCQMSILDCTKKNIPLHTEYFNDIYNDKENNRQRFNERMNYGFSKISDPNALFVAPENSGWLLFYRFPYLSNEQRLDIIRSTAGEAGYPLDNQTKKGSWQRVNLYEASFGPKRIDGTWVVDMDGQWQEKIISGFSNPYYAYDQWHNNISGNGNLIKKGRGVLALMGNNHLSGITVLNGGLILNADNELNALSEVKGGFLEINGTFNSSNKLIIGNKGILMGGGVINSPVDLRGLLSTSSLVPLTILQTLQFYPESTYQPRELGTQGAILAEGKQAHIVFDGILDARNITPGSLVDLKGGAHLSGHFNTILQPRYLFNTDLYYDILWHDRGANLYINSDHYPKISDFKGNAKEGLILLTRLQGSQNAMSNHAYQNWLNHALYTGETQLLPQLIHGQIYADMMQYLNQEIFLPNINSYIIRQSEIGQSSIWANYTAKNIDMKVDEGNIATQVQDRGLSFGFNYLLNSHVVLTQNFYLNQLKLKQFASSAKVKQITEVSGLRYYPKDNRQGFYVESGLGLGWYQFEVERQLGILGHNKAKKSGHLALMYGELGYELSLNDNWRLAKVAVNHRH